MIAEASSETKIHPNGIGSSETRRSHWESAATDVVQMKLNDLLGLPANWDGYAAAPIDRTAMLMAAKFVETASRRGFPSPEIFPVPTGGVQLEWTVGPMELEFEIEPGGRTAIFVADDSSTGRRFDGEFPRDQALFSHAMANLLAYFSERPTR